MRPTETVAPRHDIGSQPVGSENCACVWVIVRRTQGMTKEEAISIGHK
jgi:hypothetical protein